MEAAPTVALFCIAVAENVLVPFVGITEISCSSTSSETTEPSYVDSHVFIALGLLAIRLLPDFVQLNVFDTVELSVSCAITKIVPLVAEIGIFVPTVLR